MVCPLVFFVLMSKIKLSMIGVPFLNVLISTFQNMSEWCAFGIIGVLMSTFQNISFNIYSLIDQNTTKLSIFSCPQTSVLINKTS